jgi:glycosyltransferase involved in cell wall biosynthesis
VACATPVVTTRQTISALTAVPDRDLLVADDAEGFARTLLHLLEDRNRREAIGTAGRTYIETNHNWASIAAQLEEVYFGIINQTSQKSI